LRRALCLLVALAACKPEAHETKPAPSATASASASASAKPAGPVRYAGTYDAKPSDLYVPDGDVYKGFKFRGEDAGVALGEGKIVLTVDPHGGVTGTLEGPLGPSTLSGVADDGGVTFHVTPDDPKADLALSGTGTGAVSASEIKGTMQVSSWHANILREAAFSAKPAK
jgi:hypothetical protein